MKVIDTENATDRELLSIDSDYCKDLFELADSPQKVKVVSDAIEQIRLAAYERGRRLEIGKQDFIKELVVA